MGELNETQAKGAKVLAELLGPKAGEAVAARVQSGEVGSGLTALGLEFAFAGVWGREGLDRRSRSLLTIGVLIAQAAEHELRNHFKIGIQNGLTPAELEEAVIQSLPYCGFSRASPAMTILAETLRDLGLAKGSMTLAERGLK